MSLRKLMKKGLAAGLAATMAFGAVPAVGLDYISEVRAAEFNITYYDGIKSGQKEYNSSGDEKSVTTDKMPTTPKATSGSQIDLNTLNSIPTSSFYTFAGWDVYEGNTYKTLYQRSGSGYTVGSVSNSIYTASSDPTLAARWSFSGTNTDPSKSNYNNNYVEASTSTSSDLEKGDDVTISFSLGDRIEDDIREAIEECYENDKTSKSTNGYYVKIALSDTSGLKNIKVDGSSITAEVSSNTKKASAINNLKVVITVDRNSGYTPGSTKYSNVDYTFTSYKAGGSTSSSSSSGGSSGGGSSTGRTTTTSKKNTDGSTTTTTNNVNGNVTTKTETTTKIDGSSTSTVTVTDKSTGTNSVENITKNTDGSSTSVKTTTAKDGSKTITEAKKTSSGVTTTTNSTYTSTGAITGASIAKTNASGATTVSTSYNISGSNATVNRVTAAGTKLTISDTITVNGEDYEVKSIADSAVRGMTSIKKVTIPDSITSIGANAFTGDSSLKTIVIERKMTKIGSSAFSGIAAKATFKIETTKAGFKATKKAIKKAGAPKKAKYKRIS